MKLNATLAQAHSFIRLGTGGIINAKTLKVLKTTNAFPKYSGYPKCFMPSFAIFVCEVIAGITTSKNVIMLVAVRNKIFFFIG